LEIEQGPPEKRNDHLRQNKTLNCNKVLEYKDTLQKPFNVVKIEWEKAILLLKVYNNDQTQQKRTLLNAFFI